MPVRLARNQALRLARLPAALGRTAGLTARRARRVAGGVGRRIGAPRLPRLEPSEEQLRRWAVAVGVEYQAWCFHHGFVTLAEWRAQRRQARRQLSAPLISVVTPVHDTPPAYLRECIYSVRVQSYPHWELCLVDDASTDPETLAELDRLVATDPRIRLERLEQGQGICGATNVALGMARGEHVAFLDHDDRLAPDALFHVGQLLIGEPDLHAVYSDRDYVTVDGFRARPHLKPNWAPETLLAGNYLFHLTVYRRALVVELGGYRQAYEGSQDLDLALRVAEQDPRVAHVTRVLYHWREHEASMALRPNAKPFIFDAGVAAVEAALERRGIDGTVDEIPGIWRGNYRVRLRLPDHEPAVASVEELANYRRDVNDALEACEHDELAVIGPGVRPADAETHRRLIAWLGQPGIAAVTGRIVSPGGYLRHAGLVRRPGGEPLAPFEGYHQSDPGYGAMTVITRNVSLVHPLACAWRVDVLRAIGGVPPDYEGPYGMLDASIEAEHAGYRLLYDPLATFVCDDERISPACWGEEERDLFAERRAGYLAHDWQCHWALDRRYPDLRLNVGAPPYESDDMDGSGSS